MQIFLETLDDLGFSDDIITWNNCRADERNVLDRVYANLEWHNLFRMLE